MVRAPSSVVAPGRSCKGDGTGARSLASSSVSPRVSGGRARKPTHIASTAWATGSGTTSFLSTPRPISASPNSIQSPGSPSRMPGQAPACDSR